MGKFVVYISAIYEVEADSKESAGEIGERFAEACDKAVGNLDEFADGSAELTRVVDEDEPPEMPFNPHDHDDEDDDDRGGGRPSTPTPVSSAGA